MATIVRIRWVLLTKCTDALCCEFLSRKPHVTNLNSLSNSDNHAETIQLRLLITPSRAGGQTVSTLRGFDLRHSRVIMKELFKAEFPGGRRCGILDSWGR